MGCRDQGTCLHQNMVGNLLSNFYPTNYTRVVLAQNENHHQSLQVLQITRHHKVMFAVCEQGLSGPECLCMLSMCPFLSVSTCHMYLLVKACRSRSCAAAMAKALSASLLCSLTTICCIASQPPITHTNVHH